MHYSSAFVILACNNSRGAANDVKPRFPVRGPDTFKRGLGLGQGAVPVNAHRTGAWLVWPASGSDRKKRRPRPGR
jgi:hypothetical protein